VQRNNNVQKKSLPQSAAKVPEQKAEEAQLKKIFDEKPSGRVY
jgi:hypothetical protein